MRLTTPVEIPQSKSPIEYDDSIVMLGSCFTDNIGGRLVDDGFNVVVNPMGVLFNPGSIAKIIARATEAHPYNDIDLFEYHDIWHCLDFASRYQSKDKKQLLTDLNGDFENLCQTINRCKTLIITFGTSFVFEHTPTNQLVGNCHKLPCEQFVRRRMNIEEITNQWASLCSDKRIIFTVSPVRHLADGLHGNNLSKATLQLAVEQLCTKSNCEYFPAFEIVNDELRDYRFYATDMKHPSELAVDYIYERFSDCYFTTETQQKALSARRESLRKKHRPIL